MTLPSRFLPLLLLAACGDTTTPPPSEPPVSRTLSIGAPRRVRTLDVLPDSPASSDPSAPVRLGTSWYFMARHQGFGQELWRTDGTEQGTALVRDIAPGSNSGLAEFQPVELNGALLFGASDEVSGGGLWRTDGTTDGTVLVHDLREMSGVSRLTRVGNQAYFLAGGPVLSTHLWRTDGTAQGTVHLRQVFVGGKFGSYPPPPRFEPFVFRDTLFIASEGPEGIELWKSDGTGNVGLFVDLVPGTASSYPEQLVSAGERFFFVTGTSLENRGNSLWVSDGTAAGTVRLKEFPASQFGRLTLREASGGVLTFLVREDTGTGSQLTYSTWTSNGTPEGTVQVEVSPARQASLGGVKAGSLRYFAHATPEHGQELWRTDGTEAGTVRVKDLRSGPEGSEPRSLLAVDDVLYFSALDAEAGRELWRTDGTEAGTVRVADLRPGLMSSDPVPFLSGGQLFVSAEDGTRGRELYLSNGTAGGTRLVKDVNPARYQGSRPVRVGERLFFTTSVGNTGTELWTSDGTEAGTRLVKDLVPGPAGSHPMALTELNGQLYFTIDNAAEGWEVWKSDGTEAGTVLVHRAVPNRNSPYGSRVQLAAMGGGLYYIGAAEGDYALWRADGATGETRLVRRFPNAEFNLFATPVATGNRVYFAARSRTHGNEAWVSDGTSEGTRLVTDLEPGMEDGVMNMGLFHPLPEGRLLFQGARGLFLSDGTEQGTVRLAEGQYPLPYDSYGGRLEVGPVQWGDSLFFAFAAPNEQRQDELWRSNGTPGGTARVADLVPGANGSNPTSLQAVESGVLFIATTPELGTELWRSDGTAEGTRVVKDLLPGPASALAHQELVPLGDGTHVLFVAADGRTGLKLWVSDGTQGGTRPLEALREGPYPTDPRNLVASGQQVYFTAEDAQGPGLWAFEAVSTAVTPEPPVEDGSKACSAAGGGAALPVLAVVLAGLGLRRRERAKG